MVCLNTYIQIQILTVFGCPAHIWQNKIVGGLVAKWKSKGAAGGKVFFNSLPTKYEAKTRSEKCSNKGGVYLYIFCWHSRLWISLEEGEYIYVFWGVRAHTSHPRVLLSFSYACALGETLMNTGVPALFGLQSGYLQGCPHPPCLWPAPSAEQVPLQRGGRLCRRQARRLVDRNE